MKTNTKVPKTPFFAAFSVGAVLFSAHAGGGFATGNQANTYYVGLGWTGIISAVVAMLLLTLTMREAMIMYNSRGLTSYKQHFETLCHPFDKIEWAFEVFFYIMVLMAVAAAISGAASALNNYFTINYYIGVAIVGVIVLMLTIFGAGIVRAASTYMGMAILVTAISIYVIGIFKSDSSIFSVLSADFETTGFMNMPKATNCYRNCLALAKEYGVKSIAFPSISTGVYRFPIDLAAKIAIGEILHFLETDDTMEQIILVCFDEGTKAAYQKAFAELTA